MREHEQEAVVLDVFERGESDRGVALLTSRGELLFAHAPAAARSRRRFGGALQPGARVHARWTVRREGGSARLEEARLLREPPVPDPLERFYATAHLLELCRTFAREGAEDERFFRLLSAALERLDCGDDLHPLLRYVEAWSLNLSGLLPELEQCAMCACHLGRNAAYVAPDAGVFCGEHRSTGALRLEPSSAGWLRQIRFLSPREIPPLPAGADRNLREFLPALVMFFAERPLRALAALNKFQADPLKGTLR